ncbi:hypothetical protein FNYG_06828 [Fusarium nygamai]|uniref:Cytochrome P450 n=1 Tax=Gibberella nygamai TaxID=42673 RepID=A0A2K0WBT4_GIBNY|nr:hypothetical protein FNYG_06828 [Fusarium nygamai]
MARVQEEIKLANLSEMPKFKETQSLPYLSAVIKEAMRLHTPVGLMLERVVPAGGVTLCSQEVKEGTIVGCNPYFIHRSKDVYGKAYDVDEFWPERWLEADQKQKSKMDRYFMDFGSGKRMCIGRNISLLEIYKLVPLLLVRFDIQLAHPERDWHV